MFTSLLLPSPILPAVPQNDLYKAFVETLAEGLLGGECVQLAGFGTFLIRERGEHTGRNPQTGEAVTIPASRQIAFKASKSLKDAINKKDV